MRCAYQVKAGNLLLVALVILIPAALCSNNKDPNRTQNQVFSGKSLLKFGSILAAVVVSVALVIALGYMFMFAPSGENPFGGSNLQV